MKLRLGTRGSALALAQAELVGNALAAKGLEVEIVPITTSGDQRSERAAAPDDKSRFVKEIEDALLREEVGLAVHSAKDVPSELPDGLSIVGVPERADPRDALCGAATLAELSEGAAVGTSSLRRRAQLLAARPDLRVEELHGNVDTRLRKLAEGELDAIVLAAAGLRRLGREAEIGFAIPVETMVPAPGQGTLVLQARADDEETIAAVGGIFDLDAARELTAERAAVRLLDASCTTPVGVFARVEGERLELDAFVGLPDGSEWLRDHIDADAGEPAVAGVLLAERLLGAGARDLLDRAEAAA